MTTSTSPTPPLAIRSYEGATIPAPGTFVLEPGHTTVGFVARHLMVTKVRGRFADFAGTITVAEDPLRSSVDFTARVASIETGNEQRDQHLRSQDFFSAEHPELAFRTTSVTHVRGDAFRVVGDLSVNGTTRPITLDVDVDGVARDPWGGERLAVSARGEIDREDFGITWNVALESGGVLVSKKVAIEIEAQAVRQG
jgi:polyisoprenoid-binding protein YceI